MPFRVKIQKRKEWGKGFVNIYFEFLVDNLEKLRIILTCMDMKNDCMIPDSGLMPDLKGKELLVGSKQLRKALKNGAVSAVFLAQNADPSITEPLAEQCKACGIPYTWVRTMKELGENCGIDVGTAAAAIRADDSIGI